MKEFSVPGLSVAFAHRGKIKRSAAFGLANLKTKEALSTQHNFRIASVSKPITSAGIFRLVEQGKLNLNNPVFGKSGILKIEGPAGITINHLLTHTSGGWPNDKNDPMFQEIDLDHASLIDWTLKNQSPKNAPGENYAYSNFGYCLLGRVIEKITGNSYAEFIAREIFRPCGIKSMHIGDGKPGDDEVEYFDENGKPIARPMNIARMDAHGGWVGTPTEMVKFAVHFDGFEKPADILKKESIEAMTEYSGIEKSYACGWKINRHGNYWHGGSLPGLSTILVRTQSGFCWAACVNTRRKGIGLALDRLMWKLSARI